MKSDPDIEILGESPKKNKGKAKLPSKRKRCVLDMPSTGNCNIIYNFSWSVCSDNFDSDFDEDHPTNKRVKAGDHQAAVTDFFDQAGPSKTKPRAVSNAKAPAKKKPVESDFEEDSLQAIPTPPPREAPKRAARGQVKKYIEIESDTGDQDDSFVISD